MVSTADVSTSTLNVTGVTTVGVMTAASLEVTTGIATFAGESGSTQGVHVVLGSQKLKILVVLIQLISETPMVLVVEEISTFRVVVEHHYGKGQVT